MIYMSLRARKKKKKNKHEVSWLKSPKVSIWPRDMLRVWPIYWLDVRSICGSVQWPRTHRIWRQKNSTAIIANHISYKKNKHWLSDYTILWHCCYHYNKGWKFTQMLMWVLRISRESPESQRALGLLMSFSMDWWENVKTGKPLGWPLFGSWESLWFRCSDVPWKPNPHWY